VIGARELGDRSAKDPAMHGVAAGDPASDRRAAGKPLRFEG
jgi:hypothetical protein